jgi:integrating conjugative element protein (TIGR03765 family)
MAMLLMASATAVPAPVHLGPSQVRASRAPQRALPVPAPSMYPIRTAGLTPGAKNPPQLDLPMPIGRPVCLLGSDAYSFAWLRTNALLLAKGGALCYVVNVDSAATLARLRAIAPGVLLAPIFGDVFVQAGLKGFPAIITQSGAVK